MEIEPHPKDLTKGPKTSLRLRVVRLSTSNSKRYELLTREVFDGQSQSATSQSKIDPNGFEDDDELVRVIVEGVWCQAHIGENALIHLVLPRYESKTDSYVVDNSSGLLVLEPDNLLTCTAVASSLWCQRKTWLNNVFLGQVGSNRAMLVGTLVHEVFQHGLKHKIVDIDGLTEFLDEQLDDATVMLEIYSVELHMKDIREEAISYLPSVKEWIEKYMLVGPAHALTNDAETEVKVTAVKDIEENVWSTKYGLKGKVDVTGIVRVYDKRTKTIKDKILPLELKTGNPKLSPSHEAQVSLYSMMLEDRYAEYNQGLVIYLKHQAAMHNVKLSNHVKRDLVNRRNQLNYHMRSYYFGPEFLNAERTCGNCERQIECILMSNIYEHNIDQYKAMAALEKEATGHLDVAFIRFFQKYHEKLVTLMTRGDRVCDNGGDAKTLGSFWTYTSAEAETKGAGFGKLQATIEPDPKMSMIKFTRHPDHKENIVPELVVRRAVDQPDSAKPPSAKKFKIDDYFKKQPKKVDTDETTTTTTTTTTTSAIKYKPFDLSFNHSRYRMAISRDEESASMDSQNSSTALAIGFMHELKEDYFVLKVYEGALDFVKPNCMYRVDRIEKRTNPDIERLVLVRLLAKEDWRCDQVRRLILEPKFVPSENIDLNIFVSPDEYEELRELEEPLQKPVIDAICTNNYFVITEQMMAPKRADIHKMVVVLTRLICALSRTVLIVAQNLDHMEELMRLLRKTTRFILVDDGKSGQARFHFSSSLVKVPEGGSAELYKRFESYIRQHEFAPVVLTTYAMSIGGLQFTRRTFDYCIAYDASNTELLVGLAPMFCCDRQILFDVRGASISERILSEDDISLGDHLRKLRQPPSPS